jgi:hypothetical protein
MAEHAINQGHHIHFENTMAAENSHTIQTVIYEATNYTKISAGKEVSRSVQCRRPLFMC